MNMYLNTDTNAISNNSNNKPNIQTSKYIDSMKVESIK